MSVTQSQNDHRPTALQPKVLWSDSSTALALSAFLSTVLGLFLGWPALNNIVWMRRWFESDQPVVTVINLSHMVLLLCFCLLVFLYRRFRHKRRPVVDGIMVVLLAGVVALLNTVVCSASRYIFVSEQPSTLLTMLRFSEPASPMIASCWLILGFHGFVSVLSKRVSMLRTEFRREAHLYARSVLRKSITRVLWFRVGVRILLFATYVGLLFECFLLLRYASYTFADFGVGILLGVFSFWFFVLLFNIFMVWIGADWKNGRSQSAFTTGYYSVVMLIVFFYCNDATKWAQFAATVLILLSLFCFATYKDQKSGPGGVRDV
jgi:hypothetical protein